MVYEIWGHRKSRWGSGGLWLTCDESQVLREIAIEDGEDLLYSFVANSWGEACQIYNDLNGFGKYKSILINDK